jgi:signal transduction histidine kinase
MRAEAAQHAGVTLRHQATALPVHASADLGATMQIVAELLSNGLQHTRRDGTLTLSVGVQQGHACISVADQGPGLEAGQLRRLFDPLNQHDSGGPLAGEHFGLGLVIARLLAMAVGGDVRAESVPGQGSVFTLELPLHVASATGIRRQVTTLDQ